MWWEVVVHGKKSVVDLVKLAAVFGGPGGGGSCFGFRQTPRMGDGFLTQS
jgi:hypothetical protein